MANINYEKEGENYALFKLTIVIRIFRQKKASNVVRDVYYFGRLTKCLYLWSSCHVQHFLIRGAQSYHDY